MIWFDVDLIPGRPIVTWSYHIQPLIYVTLLSLNLCDFIKSKFQESVFANFVCCNTIVSQTIFRSSSYLMKICLFYYLSKLLASSLIFSFIYKVLLFCFFYKITDHIPTIVGYTVLKENSKFWGEVKPRAVYRNIKCNLEGHPEGLPW